MPNEKVIKLFVKIFKRIKKKSYRSIRGILAYHGVSQRREKNCVEIGKFISHLNYFNENFKILKLSELLDKVKLGEKDWGNYVAITFDDAYENFYLNAYPELIKRSIPATIFVPAGRVGGFNSWDYIDRGNFSRLNIMNYDELKRLDRKLIEIGSHSFTHRKLVYLTKEELEEEISGSKTILETELGMKIDKFAYPYGELFHFDDRAVKALMAAGFLYAFTTHFGRNINMADSYRINRIVIWDDDDIYDIRDKLSGYYDWMAEKERIAYSVRRMLKIK